MSNSPVLTKPVESLHESITDGMSGIDTSINKASVPRILYVIWYRQGNNPHPQFHMFFCEGTIQQVVERSKIFCNNTNKRFVQVHPAIIDMNVEEKRVLGF